MVIHDYNLSTRKRERESLRSLGYIRRPHWKRGEGRRGKGRGEEKREERGEQNRGEITEGREEQSRGEGSRVEGRGEERRAEKSRGEQRRSKERGAEEGGRKESREEVYRRGCWRCSRERDSWICTRKTPDCSSWTEKLKTLWSTSSAFESERTVKDEAECNWPLGGR